MKHKKSFALNISLALIVASLVGIFIESTFFKRLDLLSFDYLFHLRNSFQSTTPPRNIVIIDLTEDDFFNLRSSGLQPWRRLWFAQIVKSLKAFGAKSVYIDVLFSEPSLLEKDDDAMAEAMREAGNVYLPYALQDEHKGIQSTLLPLEKILSGLKGIGFVNVIPDVDGTTRRIPLFMKDKGVLFHHISLQLAMDYLGLKVQDITRDQMVLSNGPERLAIPLVQGNQMLINWRGRWKDSFLRYSFSDILAAHQALTHGVKPNIDVSSIKDSICVVGVTAVALFDLRSTPLETEYPGVGVIAMALSNLLNRDFIHVFPDWFNLLLIFLFAFIPPFLVSEDRPFQEILSILFVVFISFLTYFVFLKNYKMFIAAPLISLIGSYILVVAYNFARISIDRKNFLSQAITDGLTTLYNKKYFKMLLETECLLMKSTKEESFSIILCDIDDFKAINDSLGHLTGDTVLETVAKKIKSSLRAVDIVGRYGGDEIVILLRGTHLEAAGKVAEKIRAQVEGLVIRDDYNTCQITVSLGVTFFDPAGDDYGSLIKRVDQALYKAKTDGKNCVRIMTA